MFGLLQLLKLRLKRYDESYTKEFSQELLQDLMRVIEQTVPETRSVPAVKTTTAEQPPKKPAKKLVTPKVSDSVKKVPVVRKPLKKSGSKDEL